MPFLNEFLLIASVHLLAVASPGPDFAIILKQSLRFGRKTALYTSLGIGSGILVHVAYSLVGIGVLIASDERLYTVLKYIAASYFLYLAWHGLRAKKPTEIKEEQLSESEQQPSIKKAYLTGFLINGLNIKATLFFVSLFSMVISPTTPIDIKLAYGLYMAFATALWFSFLSVLLGHNIIRHRLLAYGFWLDRVMGGVLLLLAIQLLLSDLNNSLV